MNELISTMLLLIRAAVPSAEVEYIPKTGKYSTLHKIRVLFGNGVTVSILNGQHSRPDNKTFEVAAIYKGEFITSSIARMACMEYYLDVYSYATNDTLDYVGPKDIVKLLKIVQVLDLDEACAKEPIKHSNVYEDLALSYTHKIQE